MSLPDAEDGLGARFGLGVVVVFVSGRCGSVGDIHEFQCGSRHVVRVSHGCVGVRVQSFSVLVVPLGSERQLLSNKPFFCNGMCMSRIVALSL